MEPQTRLRASSTSTFASCELLWATRAMRKELEAAGHELRDTTNGIAASIGTAVHAGAEMMLQFKLEHGEPQAGPADAEEYAIESLKAQLREAETTYDPTTKSNNDAQIQVRRMVAVYFADLAPKFEPYKIEDYAEFDLDLDRFPGIIVSGTVDLVENALFDVRDLKTRARITPSDAHQLGTYGVLRRSLGTPCNAGFIDLIPRVAARKEQPRALVIPYKLPPIERLAYRTLERMGEGVMRWRATKDVLSFIPNPSTYLCSDRFCPAWGTDTCPAWRPEIEHRESE